MAAANPDEVILTTGKMENPADICSRNEIANVSAKPASIVDDSSDLNSEIVFRPHHNQEQRKVMSAVVAPATPTEVHSLSDAQSLQNPKHGYEKKSNNMVLRLMVPSGNLNNEMHSTSPTTPTENNEGTDNTLTRRKVDSMNYRNSLVYPVLNGSHINKAFSICESIDYSPKSPGTFSRLATPHPPDDPTPPIRKRRAFSDLLVKSLSILSAVLNVTVGLAIYIADIISDTPRIYAEIFSLILVIVAAMYIIYLTIDISIFLHKKQKYEAMLEKNIPDDIELTETPEGYYQFNITLPEVAKLGKSIKHDYCFSRDRHSSNFFLKVGATAFCLGHLIHSGLILGYQIVFLATDEYKFYKCASDPTMILDFIYPLYSFSLLFFIYKYSNVIINKNVVLARFGMMHCLSSSICFWLWTIFREVLEAIENKKYDEGSSSPNSSDTLDLDHDSVSMTLMPRRFTAICDYEDASLKAIYRDISPYLYPFSVEFSILVVGVLYLVWQNIGICKAEDENEAATTTQCKTMFSNNAETIDSNVAIHADCQASNKGLFCGIVVLVLIIVTCILFFIAIYLDNGTKADMGITATLYTSIFVLSTMIIACALGYRQITKLDLNSAHHNLLDDVLLFICMPAFFLNGVFSLIASIKFSNAVGAINISIEIFQVLLQTVFLLDGVRRSSNTRKLRKQKPGRELVTFLIISNIALWLMQTFEVKAHGIQDNRYDLYGKELWTIIGHLCLPLMMFYRFHSSVCFGDIWKYAYEPSGH